MPTIIAKNNGLLTPYTAYSDEENKSSALAVDRVPKSERRIAPASRLPDFYSCTIILVSSPHYSQLELVGLQNQGGQAQSIVCWVLVLLLLLLLTSKNTKQLYRKKYRRKKYSHIHKEELAKWEKVPYDAALYC